MKESTRLMIKKHGWRLDRALHNYIYFTFYYPYVFTVYHIFSFLARYLSWFKPLTPVLRAAFNRYHAKIISFGDTKKIFTLDHDVMALTPRTKEIVPFKYARKIIFQDPEHIAVMDCPCKKTLGDEDWTINSCLAVGKATTAFWLDHGKKYNAKKITQQEALDLISRFRKAGYLTQAFFKVATGGCSGVICNCHPDTCVSLKATEFGRKFNPSLNMNAHAGYAVNRDRALCDACGSCAEIGPGKAITVTTKEDWILDENRCYGCELCVESCDKDALSLVRDPSKPVPFDLDIVKESYM